MKLIWIVCATALLSGQAVTSDLVSLGDVAPTVRREMRYQGAHNFVGRPIAGYLDPVCLLTRQAARALTEAQREAEERGYTLKVYDCYRPRSAVADFVQWAKGADQAMKAEFYPRVDKGRLFGDGYIAEKSAHSRGSTVDLTLVRLPARGQRGYRPGEKLHACDAKVRFPDNSIDMGTGYDCFDTTAHTLDPRVKGAAHANRLLLKRLMRDAGFVNYPKEWWHYTLADEPFPQTSFDVPVQDPHGPAAVAPGP